MNHEQTVTAAQISALAEGMLFAEVMHLLPVKGIDSDRSQWHGCIAACPDYHLRNAVSVKISIAVEVFIFGKSCQRCSVPGEFRMGGFIKGIDSVLNNSYELLPDSLCCGFIGCGVVRDCLPDFCTHGFCNSLKIETVEIGSCNA